MMILFNTVLVALLVFGNFAAVTPRQGWAIDTVRATTIFPDHGIEDASPLHPDLKPAEAQSSFGTIAGVVRYPSEYLPPMRVYAISADGKRHYRTSTRSDQTRFVIRNIPPGSYHVVAYSDEAAGAAGGWSRAVPCGLQVTCRDHRLIPVAVVAGRTTADIAVADWYASPGTFPSEPARDESATGVSNIRAIDFRNFTYQRKGAEPLVLHDGKEAEEVEGSKLLSVKYVDFDRDGKEEALVTIATGRRGEGGYAEEYFVYAYRNGQSRQVFRESRQKPQDMQVRGRSLVITAPFWKRADPGCCPSAMETVGFIWRGSGFVRASRQLRPIRR